MSKKVRKIITCPYCNKKLNLDELIKLGYVEEMGKTKVVWCPSCDNQFVLN